MTGFAEAALLVLLIAMVGWATISGMVLTQCVEKENASAAWVWASMFWATSLVAALVFGRLV